MDSTDLLIVLTAMDARPGYPTWNALADLDGDGEVTSSDLAFVLRKLP